MRYFLNIRTKDSLIRDPEGDAFYDVDQLLAYAKQVVEELEREFPIDAKDAHFILVMMEVVDETGAVVFSLPIHAPGAPEVPNTGTHN
jgi:hypothetical protein